MRRTSRSSTENEQKQKRKLWLLIIPVTTFCLGTWQVFRLQWKLGLIDELERRTMKPAINIPNNVADRLEELEYRRVTLTGQFDHTREIHMWPRGQLSEEYMSKQRSEPGAHIITPFYCNETQSYILVNRGWVPKSRMNPVTRPQGQIEGQVILSGLVRTQEKRPPFSPKNDPDNNRWSWRDVVSMAQCLGTTPVMIDADATTTLHGGPIGGQTRITLRNDHLQYVFTWYALSLATFYMFWQFWKKRAKR